MTEAKALGNLSGSIGDATLTAIIEMTDDFPAPPMLLTQILELTSDPATPVDKVATVLSGDVGITAKLLKLSNSAFYGHSRTVTSVKQAIVMLGFHTVRSLVVAASTQSLYAGCKDYEGLRKGMWEHSLATAVFAKILATRLSAWQPEEAYVAGLLHDIGKLVLLQRFPERFAAMIAECKTTSENLLRMENAHFGCTHDLVGAYLVDRWLFPESLVASVGLHHQSQELETLAGITALANLFVTAQSLNIHDCGETAPQQLEEFGLNEFADEFTEQFTEHRSLFAI